MKIANQARLDFRPVSLPSTKLVVFLLVGNRVIVRMANFLTCFLSRLNFSLWCLSNVNISVVKVYRSIWWCRGGRTDR